MALSGSFQTSTWTNSSTGSKSWLVFSWTASQSIANNTSTISWTLKGARSVTGYVRAGGFKVVIDGETVYSKSTDYRIDMYNGTVIASGTKTITHQNDGARSFSVSAEGGIYYNAVNSKGSATFTLDTIPRASSISCTKADVESNPTIAISRASSSFTHTVTYSFGSLSGTIATKTSATSITSWTIPSSFYAQIPSAKTGKGTLTCITYNGSTKIGESTCELSVTTSEAKCKPDVSGTVVDTNSKTIALTGDSDVLVRYHSTAKCTISASAKNSASISAKTINNTSATSAITISNVETGVFDFYAKDSRGYYNSDKVIKTLVEYVKLTCNITATRKDPTSGKAEIKISGNYFNGNFGKAANELTVKYKQGDGDYISVTPTISGNKYSAKISLTGLTYTESFTYDVVVEDKLTSIPKPATIKKGIPVFDWGENDFAFHVPVSIQDNPLIDFVMEQGVENGWLYRKWKSGLAECWYRKEHTVAITDDWGGLYAGTSSTGRTRYPFEFKEKPHETVTIKSSHPSAFAICSSNGNGDNTTTATASYNAVRPSAITDEYTMYFEYYVVGYLK